MRVVLVSLSGDESECELKENATVGDARSVAATSHEVKTNWISLTLNESYLTDDTVLLQDFEGGSAGIRLTVLVRRPWSWTEVVDGVVSSSNDYKHDPELSILLQHFNEGNGGEGHGRIVVSGTFPSTPAEVLAFLRGEPLSEEDIGFDPAVGVECWALDESAPEGRWRPARVLCTSHPGDLIGHFTIEWTDMASDGESCSGGKGVVLELRMLEDTKRGYTAAMTKDYTKNRMGMGCHNFALDFGFKDAEDAWNNMPTAPPNVQCIQKRKHLAARPPPPRIHDPVFPLVSTEEDYVAPWWDILELEEVGPDHVTEAAKQTACYVSRPADYADRAARALRALVGASPEDSDEVVAEKTSHCKFYTHSRTVEDGDGEFYVVTGMGWDPLVIAANSEDRTISFAFANGTD